jgi:hypothetical protein
MATLSKKTFNTLKKTLSNTSVYGKAGESAKPGAISALTGAIKSTQNRSSSANYDSDLNATLENINAKNGGSTVLASDIGNITRIQAPALAPINTPSLNNLEANNAALGIYSKPETAETGKQKSTQDYLSEVLNMYQEPVNQSSLYDKAERQAGIRDKENLVQSLSNQLNTITTRGQQDIISLRGVGSKEGVTEAVYGGQQSEIARETALQALPVQAQLAAAQGDLQTAQSRLDTLFKMYVDTANSKIDFYNKSVDYARELFSKSEQRQIDAQKEKNSMLSSSLKGVTDFQDKLANEALKNGNYTLAAKIASIRPPVIGTPSYDEDKQIYEQAINKYAKQLNPGLTPQQQKDIISAQQTSEMIPELNDKINLIDSLISGVDGSGAVGPNVLARTSLLSWATGKRQSFVGGVKQLISKGTLDTLINLKKAGGTLGALSDQERIMLQNSASKIGGWEIQDNGVGSGFYNVNEKDFKKELETLKMLTQRAINNAKGISADNPLGFGMVSYPNPLNLEL